MTQVVLYIRYFYWIAKVCFWKVRLFYAVKHKKFGVTVTRSRLNIVISVNLKHYKTLTVYYNLNVI